MTSKRMQKEIDKLKAQGGELSAGAAKRLRQLEHALPNQIADEQKRSAERAKRKAAGFATPVRQAPKDDGLSGATWTEWFDRYCDPLGIGHASFDQRNAPKRAPKRPAKAKAAQTGAMFNMNGRRVAMLVHVPVSKIDGSPMPDQDEVVAPSRSRSSQPRQQQQQPTGIGRLTVDRMRTFVETFDAGKLEEVFGARAPRLAAKMDLYRAAVATA